jgi:CTP synthase
VTKEKSPTNVVIPMEELDQTQMGGTMRLGLRATHIRGAHTRAATIYQDTIIYERHRHRYEINPVYRPVLEKNGLTISGTDETDTCVHLIEDSALRFYIGCQYHPEYENSLRKPSKLFVEFVKKASKP